VTETAGRTAATWRARIRPAPIVPLFRCIHGRMTLRWAETFHHANPAISGLVWTFRRCDPEKGLCVRREAPSSRNTFWAKILKMRENINSHNEDYGTTGSFHATDHIAREFLKDIKTGSRAQRSLLRFSRQSRKPVHAPAFAARRQLTACSSLTFEQSPQSGYDLTRCPMRDESGPAGWEEQHLRK